MTPTELREARAKLGLTAEEMAKLLGYAPRTVWRWESGENRIPGPVPLVLAPLLMRAHRAADMPDEMVEALDRQIADLKSK